MEEDIRILTAFLLANIPEIITKEEFVEVKQAIKNLISRNKELEEKVNKYEKQIDLEWVEENYIEKSKIREKRKEIYDFIDSSQGCMAQEDLDEEWGKYKMCGELLQDKE